MATWNPVANDLFLRALDIADPAARQDFLDRACEADPGLRAQVDSLLEARNQAGNFLEHPAAGFPPTQDLPGAVQATSGVEAGQCVGQYKLLQKLGEGGMGTVWVAEQEHPVRRRVALKLIKPGMDSKQVLTRFEQERQALALMDHTNIAKVFDAGTTEAGRPYFAMELVKGVPITRYCDELHLPVRERLGLFVAVCRAIQHAHQKGVIHRDLKPSNVLVAFEDGKPVPKVIDFGVAKALNAKLTEQTLYTEIGAVIGTLEYMAPEQAELSALDVDTRADVHALGALLYELLTGSTPLTRARLKDVALAEALRLIREEEPPRPSTRLTQTKDDVTALAAKRRTEPRKLGAEVRGELDWIVMKCLEKDRTRRYETANGLAKDVERYLRDEPVEACPPSAGYRFRKFARRYRGPLATAGVCAGLLVAGTVVSAVLAVKATRAEKVAADHQQTAERNEAQARGEAEKARALVAMLQKLLGAANPDTANGADYTVRQMLDDFETGLDDELKRQFPDPKVRSEIEAELRTTIGLAYSGMHLTHKADQQLLRARELRKAIVGPDDPTVAVIRTHIAWNMRNEEWGFFDHLHGKQFTTTVAEAREAVAVLRQHNVRGDDLTRALTVLAWCLLDQEVINEKYRLDEAERTFREALGVAEETAGGRPTLLVAVACTGLAITVRFLDKPDEALTHAKRSVELHKILSRDKDPSLAQSRMILGNCYALSCDHASAEHEYRAALDIYRRAHGNAREHPMVVWALRCLVMELDNQFEDAKADALLAEYRSAWRTHDYFRGEIELLHSRALACINRGDYADAEQHFRRARDICLRNRGAAIEHSRVSSEYGIAATLYLQGHHEQARAEMRTVLTALQHAIAKPDATTGVSLDYVCAVLIGWPDTTSELDGAIGIAQKLMTTYNNKQGRTMAFVKAIGAVLRQKRGDRDRALSLLREANAQIPRVRRFEARLIMSDLVDCLTECENRDEIETVLRDALQKTKAVWSDGHPETAAARVNLADLLIAKKSYDEAESLLLAADKALSDHAQSQSTSLKRRRADVADQLIKLYTAWGKQDKLMKRQAERAKYPPEEAPQPRPAPAK